MAPILHLVRHAQGLHNVNFQNHRIRDPDLTALGVSQCQELASNFPHDRIDLICASPLRRTLRTALLVFADPLRDRQLEILALPDAQETGAVACDMGSELPQLREEFASEPVDLSLLWPNWWRKAGRYSPDAGRVKGRALALRQWLRDRPEKEIALVTHGGFVHFLTDDWTGCNTFHGTGWANCEWRTFEYLHESPGTESTNVPIRETEASKARRGYVEKPLSPIEKDEIQQTGIKTPPRTTRTTPSTSRSNSRRSDDRDWVGGF